MKKDIAGTGTESTAPTFEVLERLVREQAQAFIQRVLEEEVTELLGREKSERIEVVDGPRGYQNGYGRPSTLVVRFLVVFTIIEDFAIFFLSPWCFP